MRRLFPVPVLAPGSACLVLILGLSSCGSSTTRDCPPCEDLDSACSLGVCDTRTYECVAEPRNEGGECDDRDDCTTDDVCTEGECAGTPVDCSERDDECNLGACRDGACVAGPREDGSACLSKDDECNDGECFDGACAAVARSDGTGCNDGDWCTDVDACQAGECVGQTRDCSDGLDCTTDLCNPDNNACDHVVAAGSCAIAGDCQSDGEVNPDNACQSCLSDVDQQRWSDDDSNTCDDGNPCTDPDACAGGVCTGTPLPGCCSAAADCDDGRACTTDACDVGSGICSNAVDAGLCLIGGECFIEGQLNPANECQECQADAGQTAWTSNSNPCNDGLFCTNGDACRDGVCQGAAGSVCDDGIECTTDVCDEASSTCVHDVPADACRIGGSCYAAAQPRPDNSCLECDPAASQSDWTPRADGSPCDDGSFCNYGEACNAGVCEGGGPRDCDDGLGCTGDSCDEAQARCENAVDAGWCLIDGSCRADSAINPDNACQECRAAVDQAGWTDDDSNSCDDGDWCTVSDACQAGSCLGSARNCDDGLSCTSDSCNTVDERCDNALQADACLIGGGCLAAGAANPDNPCQACIPASSQSGWSDENGSACDDGNACTDPDMCSAGLCTGTPLPGCCAGPADCDDGSPCTDDVCDPGDGTCSNPILADMCYIGGACYVQGQENPDNSCQGCDSAVSDTGWTVRADGSPCDDGQFCTVDEACVSGVCQGGLASDCSDGLGCTEDTCDEGADTCDHNLLPDRCLIGGACYADGQPDPGEECRACQVAADQGAWTPRADGSDCGGTCRWCQAGSCVDVPDSGVDPFVECAACQVCDGSGGCRPAADGTDPKDECDDSDCTLADCQAGSCDRPAGAQCADLSPGNCADARCDGGGLCVQDYAPEPGGDSVLCRQADDVCDLAEYCDGANLTCPDDLVRTGGFECRAAGGECDPAESCDGVSRFCPDDAYTPAGVQCADGSPDDCLDARCDGLGACVQDYDFEAQGAACTDGDVCTGPDLCDAIGQCLGASLAPEPDPASPVAATATCLTSGTGARSVVSLQLRDLSAAPIEGATVTIAGTGPETWAGPVVESLAQPGTYHREMLAPGSTGSTEVTVTAQAGSGGCSSALVSLNTFVTVLFVDPAASGTGGCSPVDNNLRVKVIDAENGAPIAGAYVMVGAAPAALFEDDYENVLAGAAPGLDNHGQTGADGVIEFVDHGSNLEGPQMVTTGFDGRGYFTLVDVDASDIVVPLTAIIGPPPSSQVDGWLTGMGSTDRNGFLDVGLVTAEFEMDSMARFKFDDMMASEYDCWLATDHFLVGDTWVEMPANVYVPDQEEFYILFWIPIYEHRYRTRPIPDGTFGHRITAISGRAPFGDVIGAILDGSGLTAIIPLLDTQRIGVYTTDVNGNQSDVPIDLGNALSENVTCSMSNIPTYADSLCFTVGDWDGGTGEGPMFVMGFGMLPGGTGDLTTVSAAGDFAGIGYVGLAVATYLDPAALPAGEEWRAGASSGRLDRSGTSFDGSGGSLVFDDFLGVTPLARAARTHSFDPVDTATPVDYTEHTIDLVQSVDNDLSPDCGVVEEEVWRSTYWKILAPAGTLSFTLPDLPAGWPRQADGGLAAPGAGERINWSFAAFHLGLLGAFDFNAFDFVNALLSTTHTSTNDQDF